MKYLVAALVLAFSGALAAPVENLEVAFDDADGRFVYGFKLLLSGKEWLRSGPVAVRNNGEWFYSDDQSLKLNTIGEDTGEGFDMKSFDFIAGNGSFRFTAYVKVYKDIPVVEFGQVFKDGASSYFPSEEMLLSSFPTFLMEDTGADLGSIVFSGGQVSTTNVQKWPDHKLYSGLDGGFPVVFFDKEMENTIVMSPRNTFMSSVQATWNPKTIRTAVVGFGLLGSVKEVPEGYVYKTVLVAGQNITGTMEKWGKLLQQDYNREEWYRYNDLTNKYLGYWTDNGACYHYCTGDYDNYEDALIAEKEYADETGIPYRYLQLDSWWYYKGVHDGVKNWTAMPSVFPHGLAYIAEKWNTPIVAHNRFWSSNTDYAKQNGGSYNFIIHGDYALPDDTAFWPDLIGSAKSEWGLYVYEQDWLYTEYEGLSELATDLNLGRQWLMQMGDGALEKDLTIQYCMSWVRHLLQAVEIPVVTQVRVSGDYHPGNSQWQIGDSTILAHSLGIAAFKDNFHSMVVEDQCCNLKRETDPALEATIAALSKGPVGIGDEVGKSDKTQIMSTCRSDGRLLQPTRPAMSLDSTFVQRAFGTGGPAGQLYVAYTEIAGFTWYYIVAADITTPYNLAPSELPPSSTTFPNNFPLSLAFRYNLKGEVYEAMNFTNYSRISIPICGRDDFQYWTIAPVLPYTEAAFIGELDKVVSVSESRVQHIDKVYDGYNIHLIGAPGENVKMSIFRFLMDKIAYTVTCKISSLGTALLRITENGYNANCA